MSDWVVAALFFVAAPVGAVAYSISCPAYPRVPEEVLMYAAVNVGVSIVLLMVGSVAALKWRFYRWFFALSIWCVAEVAVWRLWGNQTGCGELFVDYLFVVWHNVVPTLMVCVLFGLRRNRTN